VTTQPSADHRLKLLAPLGHGGMSDVWLGSLRGPAGFEKLVAVKQLRFVQSEFDRGSAFLREARLAAMLNHPNIVQTFEVMAQGGDYRIVMEFLEGQPLNKILRRAPGTIPRTDLVRVLSDVLTGLQYAHELQDRNGKPLRVVHRDVSPHNVYVSWEGDVKLLDFGIAAFETGETTTEGLVKGKLGYMAPEQARGESVDRRADIYAVGMMLWEILAGRPMWTGHADPLMYTNLVEGNLPPIDRYAPKAPVVLRRICTRALSHDPDHRYQTAVEMRQVLEEWMATNGGRPSPRSLGDHVSELFAPERERLKSVVAHSLATDDHSDETDLYAPNPTRNPRPASREGQAKSVEQAQPGCAVSLLRWLVPLTGAAGAMVLGAAAVLLVGGLAVAGLLYARPDLLEQSLQAVNRAQLPPGACPEKDRPTVELSGNVDADADLPCARDYKLSGVVRIQSGATLTIAPGTVVRGERGSVIVVEPGGRLVADGRPDAPVVFTSAQPVPAPGDWGGIVVLGRAPTNLTDPRFKGLTEEGDKYGGERVDDTSGVFRYVRIEYAGTVLAPNNETNGITFAGVGRGTVVDHVQVRHGADDCFEWFGGTVDATHLICLDPGDDGYDIEYGYVGKLSYVLLVDSRPGNNEQHAVEVDNDSTGSPAKPRTAPVLEHATLCATAPQEGYGLLVRRGAAGSYTDVWVDGFAAALDLRDKGKPKVSELSVGPGVPVGPTEDLPDDPSLNAAERGNDDFGVDEAKLAGAAGSTDRCAMPPVGAKGGLTSENRWDAGWAIWQ
jgi:serine/threonine protein kinase